MIAQRFVQNSCIAKKAVGDPAAVPAEFTYGTYDKKTDFLTARGEHSSCRYGALQTNTLLLVPMLKQH